MTMLFSTKSNLSIDRSRFWSITILLFFLFAYMLTARGKIQNSDEMTMYASLMNLVEKHTLAIDELNTLNQSIDLRIGFYGADGHLYSKYSPGNILFGGILYWVGSRIHPLLGNLFVLYLNAFLGAIGMLLLFKMLMRYFSVKTSIAVVMLIGLCSDWWYQSRGFGLETGGGVLLLASLMLADRSQLTGSAASFGMSLYFRTLNILALPVWLLGWWRTKRFDVKSVGILAITGVGLLGYNWVRFGSVTNFGYDNVSFTTPLFVGLSGLLFSPGCSIFVYSPVLFFSFLGIWKWLKFDKSVGIVLITTIILYILSVATWVSCDSGWSWGSRLLTPVIPLMGLAFAPLVDLAWSKWGWMLLIIVAGLWGFGIELLALVSDPLITLKEAVMIRGISYDSTIYSWQNSWIILQYQSLSKWSLNDLDALILRSLLKLFMYGGK